MLRLLCFLAVFTATTVRAGGPCNLDCSVKRLLEQWQGQALGLEYVEGGLVTVRIDDQHSVQVKWPDFVFCFVPALFAKTVGLVRDRTSEGVMLCLLGLLTLVMGLLSCLGTYLESRIKRVKALKRKTPVLPLTVKPTAAAGKKIMTATANKTASIAVNKNGISSEVTLTVAARETA